MADTLRFNVQVGVCFCFSVMPFKGLILAMALSACVGVPAAQPAQHAARRRQRQPQQRQQRQHEEQAAAAAAVPTGVRMQELVLQPITLLLFMHVKMLCTIKLGKTRGKENKNKA